MSQRRSRLASTWPNMKPFAITRPSQFRPQPPISLNERRVGNDYNELNDYGGKTSAKRTAQQTEIARFWLWSVRQPITPSRASS